MNTNENFSEASEDEFQSVAVFGISALSLIATLLTIAVLAVV
jgi:hypothetical protein